MVNPVATIIFDVFLIGAAGCILAAMVAEAGAARRPGVGLRSRKTNAVRASAPVRDAGQLVEARRRAHRRAAA